MKKIKLTETDIQRIVKRIINESYYDKDKIYTKEYISRRLNNAPLYIKKYLSQLESFECVNKLGEQNICVKIPEVIHVFLFGSSF